jgi:hypothetical protein
MTPEIARKVEEARIIAEIITKGLKPITKAIGQVV